MLDSIKQHILLRIDEHEKNKAAMRKVQLEKEAEELRKEQERIELQQKALEEEKAKLRQLTDKELMVELIFAIRGFYAEFQELTKYQKEIKETMADVDSRLEDMEYNISNLRSDIDSIKNENNDY